MVNKDDTKIAIVLIIFGLSVASFTGALMKLLSGEFSAFQITWFRFLGYALILFPFVYFRIGRAALKTTRPAMQVIRGVTMGTATVFFIMGAKSIDFADAIAIVYAYPFLLTLLAVIFLKERVRWIGWIGVIGGFLGVLLVMRPEFKNFNIGSLFVFLCAVVISVQLLLNRKLGSSSHPLVTSIWGAVVAALILSTVVPFHWVPINFEQFGLLSLMAVCGTINHTCLVYGFSKAEASTLAPFTYFEIVASVIIGFLMFGTLPNWLSWAGIVVIIVSGLIVARSMTANLSIRPRTKY
jgi:drug/metabolite transporter (DMT)-like permease